MPPEEEQKMGCEAGELIDLDLVGKEVVYEPNGKWYILGAWTWTWTWA
jgi:hypothetical protein